MTAPDSNRQPRDVSALAAIAAVHLLLGFLLLAPGYIRPDSVAVYSYVRSATIDRDLLFFDEWAGFRLIVDGVTLFKEVTPTGALANHWWIGTSLLVAPAYLLAHAVTLLTGWWPADGFFGLYAAVLAWATVVFGVVTSSIAYSLLGRLGIKRGVRIASIVAVWLGTPLLWYEYRFPLGTHLAGAMCVSIIAWLSFRMISGEERRFDALLLGVWFGLAIATRLQHGMLGDRKSVV